MTRLALRELFVRRTTTVLVALGLVTATVGYVCLAGTAQTTQAVLSRDIKAAWPAPYDILVRPRGAQDPLEASAGLVRPNYLSGLGGGITPTQLDEVRSISGVKVAAPIAIVGFTNWPAQQPIDLTPYVEPDRITFFRLSATSKGEGGRSAYPPETTLIAAATSGRTVFDYARSKREPGPTPGFVQTTLETPFGDYGCRYPEICLAPIECVGHETALGANCRPRLGPVPTPADRPQSVGWPTFYPEPILIAGVDPASEARLVGVDRCVTQGRFLRAEDKPGVALVFNQPVTGIPALVSTRSFIDETVSIHLDRAIASDSARSPTNVTAWQAVPSADLTTSAQALYSSFLPSVSSLFRDAGPIFAVGPVRYAVGGPHHFGVEEATVDQSVLADMHLRSYGIAQPVPEASDIWLRKVSESIAVGGRGDSWTWSQVGTYDPNCLPSFATTAGRMDAYTVPQVRTPDGAVLMPTRSLASYTNIPPLVLTTLAGARYFAQAASDRRDEAFISAIRIRLDGTDQFSPAAEARLARVAAEIERTTGLQADVIRGSSPRPVEIDLPAGNFGRPALTVTEAWTEKGVGFRFARATSLVNVLLFVLALVACTLLVAQTSYTSVRQRRRELGMLRALGWPAYKLALLVELEAGIIGLGAAFAGPAIAYALIDWFKVGIVPASPLIAAPLAVCVALLAALGPAVMVARDEPLEAMSERGRVRPSRAAASVLAIGARNLLHAWGIEALAGIAGVWLAATLVGALVLITTGFRGQLDTSILGVALAEHVAPYHYALLGITALIGLLGAAEVLTLSYLERRAQLGLLRALGWPRRAIAELLLGEATVVALAAAGLGVLAVILIGYSLASSWATIGLASAAAAGLAIATTFIAMLVPVVMGFALEPSRALQRV